MIHKFDGVIRQEFKTTWKPLIKVKSPCLLLLSSHHDCGSDFKENMGRYSSGDKFKHQEDEIGDKRIRDENWSMLEIGTHPLLWGRKLFFELWFN